MGDKHTELPWKIEMETDTFPRGLIKDRRKRLQVTTVGNNTEANAEFIVRACNSHYDLINVARCALADLEGLRDEGIFYDDENKSPQVITIKELKQAIAKTSTK